MLLVLLVAALGRSLTCRRWRADLWAGAGLTRRRVGRAEQRSGASAQPSKWQRGRGCELQPPPPLLLLPLLSLLLLLLP